MPKQARGWSLLTPDLQMSVIPFLQLFRSAENIQNRKLGKQVRGKKRKQWLSYLSRAGRELDFKLARFPRLCRLLSLSAIPLRLSVQAVEMWTLGKGLSCNGYED